MIITVIISGIIGVSVLIFGYGFNVRANEGYTAGECYTAPGLVLAGQCQVDRPGCWSCYQACWTAFYGLTVVKGVVVYFFLGTYFDQQSAQDAINYQIGQDYGICYYSNGGQTIIFQLADEYGTLIAGLVFTCFAAVIMVCHIITHLCETEKEYNKIESVVAPTETDRLVVQNPVTTEHSINTIV